MAKTPQQKTNINVKTLTIMTIKIQTIDSEETIISE